MMPPPSLSPILDPQHDSGRNSLEIPSFTIHNGASRSSAMASAFGDSILSGYASHIDTFTNGESHAAHQEKSTSGNALSPSPPLIENGKSDSTPLQIPGSPAFGASKSFLHHRKLRSDVVPRQTIMKALASRPPATSKSGIPLSAGLLGVFSNQGENDRESTTPNASSQCLSAAFANSQLDTQTITSPSARRFSTQSPCFFHQRFDGIINFDKVL